jgi:hypothetical protein
MGVSYPASPAGRQSLELKESPKIQSALSTLRNIGDSGVFGVQGSLAEVVRSTSQ